MNDFSQTRFRGGQYICPVTNEEDLDHRSSIQKIDLALKNQGLHCDKFTANAIYLMKCAPF